MMKRSQNDLFFQDFSCKNLKEIPASDIRRPKIVQSLNLSHNNLSSLFSISKLSNIKVLNLSNNALADLSELLCLKSLESLSVSNNLLCSLDGIQALTQLKVLSVSHNQIKSLSGIEFLVNLQSLELCGNLLRVDSFINNHLISLKQLKHVDLRNNCISRVDTLSKCLPRSIEVLLLEENHLFTICSLFPLGIFTRLRALHLSGNPCADPYRISERSLRSFIVFVIPSLVSIDKSPVSTINKKDAKKLFKKSESSSDCDDEVSLALLSAELEDELLQYLNDKIIPDKLNGVEIENNINTRNIASLIDDVDNVDCGGEFSRKTTRCSKSLGSYLVNTDRPSAALSSSGSIISGNDGENDTVLSVLLAPSSGSLLTATEFISKVKVFSSATSSPRNHSRVSDFSTTAPIGTIVSAIMKKSARESASFLAAIVKFQAIIRGVSVRRGIDLFHKISSAAAKIQSAYRRYRVLKWIYNTDSSSCDILGRSTVRDHIHGNIVSDPDESLVIMDHLCGFYSPDKKETGKIKINQTITPIDLSDTPVKRAINSASPDSQVIIKAMQLEIKRLQRLISRQGPPLPIDPS